MKNDNKKIKNATPTKVNEIEFKSSLEARLYKVLLEHNITPSYEKLTWVLSEKIRPTVGFYNRTKKRGFHYEMHPIQAVTYTPDFTFMYNNILVIIEVKGFENDTFPIKKNLFRKQLEEFDGQVLFFEIRTKAELLTALNIVKMESSILQTIRKGIVKLPEKDIAIANSLIDKRDFDGLLDLVSSAIDRVTRNKEKYAEVEVAYLHKLKEAVYEYNEARSI